MSETSLSSGQLKKLCDAGNQVNTLIESPDFLEVRKGLDACVSLLREMVAMGAVDSYLAAKLALAFAAGLAITEQGSLLSNLFELGRLFNDDAKVLEARCNLGETYDGMQLETRLEPRDLRLLSMGMFFACNPECVQLSVGDAIVILQIKMVEKVLLKLEIEQDTRKAETLKEELISSFTKIPALVFEHLGHSQLPIKQFFMAFWEYLLEKAWGKEIPEDCRKAFGQMLSQIPVVERHNHIRLLPMLEWNIDSESTSPVQVFTPNGLPARRRSEATSELQTGWFREIPMLGGPIRVILTLYFLTSLIAVGPSMGFFWTIIAITLASTYYRVCLLFKEEMNEGIAPTIAFLIYLFVGFMSIGALVQETLIVGMMAALFMNIAFPSAFGVILTGRRKIIEAFTDIYKNDKKRLK